MMDIMTWFNITVVVFPVANLMAMGLHVMDIEFISTKRRLRYA